MALQGKKQASLGQNDNFDERKDKFGTSLSEKLTPNFEKWRVRGQLPLILVQDGQNLPIYDQQRCLMVGFRENFCENRLFFEEKNGQNTSQNFVYLQLVLREDINRKKTFSFGHCPNHLNPPPHDPNSGNLVLFFRKSKFKI